MCMTLRVISGRQVIIIVLDVLLNMFLALSPVKIISALCLLTGVILLCPLLCTDGMIITFGWLSSCQEVADALRFFLCWTIAFIMIFHVLLS